MNTEAVMIRKMTIDLQKRCMLGEEEEKEDETNSQLLVLSSFNYVVWWPCKGLQCTAFQALLWWQDSFKDKYPFSLRIFFNLILGISCPCWHRHRTGCRWSPVRTLPYRRMQKVQKQHGIRIFQAGCWHPGSAENEALHPQATADAVCAEPVQQHLKSQCHPSMRLLVYVIIFIICESYMHICYTLRQD